MTHPLRQACQFCGRNVRSLTACQESHGVPTVGEVNNIANAGWVFVSDQVLQRDVVSLWLSLGQLLLAILAFALAMLFVIVSKKTEKDGTAITLTVLSRPYTDDNSEVAEATKEHPVAGAQYDLTGIVSPLCAEKNILVDYKVFAENE